MKKLLGAVLAALLALTVLPHGADVISGDMTSGLVTTAWAEEETPHTHCICGAKDGNHKGNCDGTIVEWEPYGTPFESGKNYYLTGNMIANGQWSITQSGSAVCLNGHNITDTREYTVMQVQQNFTLTDCEPEGQRGKITHDAGLQGGCVRVTQNGTFNMYGGCISGNTNSENGGGVLVDGGAFNMYGGTISNNSANNGGGVYVKSNATFTMSGGTISGNAATAGYGGGVYLENGTFNLSGGTIGGDGTGDANTASGAGHGGGGVWADANQTINVSGNPVIKGNKNDASDDSNVWLYNTTDGTNLAKINVVGDLTTGAYIEINYPESITDQLTVKNNAQYTLTAKDWQNVLTAGTGGEQHVHNYRWGATDAEHYQWCSGCNSIINKNKHVYDDENDTTCNMSECNHVRPAINGTLTISVLDGGELKVGNKLTCSYRSTHIGETKTIRWYRQNGDRIEEINVNGYYVLTEDDVGKTIYATLYDFDRAGIVTSNKLGPVAAGDSGEIDPGTGGETTPTNRYYYYNTADNTNQNETKGAPKTFDAGVGVYAASAVLSLAGMAYVGKKKS